jgi:hypothetical protein
MHEIPGRLRVRCPPLRKDVEKTTAIRETLELAAGVSSVAVNSTTGSFTVYYDQNRTTTATLLSVLEQHGCRLDIAPVREPSFRVRSRPIAIVGGRALSPHAPQVARVVAAFVVEKAIERSLLALIAAVL